MTWRLMHLGFTVNPGSSVGDANVLKLYRGSNELRFQLYFDAKNLPLNESDLLVELDDPLRNCTDRPIDEAELSPNTLLLL